MPRGRRALIAFVAVALVGIVGAWEIAKRVAYASQDFNPAREEGQSDCDQCGLTALLDGLPYLLGTLAAYLVLVIAIFVAIKRRGGFSG